MRRTPTLAAGLILLTAACDQGSVQVISNGEVTTWTAAGLQVLAEDGVAPNAWAVRNTDARGLSSGVGEVEVPVDGEASSATTDPFGYATFTVDEAGLTDVDGTAIATLDGSSGGPMLPRALPGLPEPAEVVRAADGVLFSSGSTVWWSGPGLPDHVVVDLGAPIAGLRPAQLDDDGVMDAVVWGGDEVLLLRGRPGGGAGFGAGVTASGWTAIGAGGADLDEDGDLDLAIAWDTGSEVVLQVWGGSGPWQLEPLDERALASAPVDLAVAADQGDGRPIITMLVPGSEWERFRLSEGGLVATSKRLVPDALEGARLHVAGDITGDGATELLVVNARRSGAERVIEMWDVASDQPTLLDLTVQGGWFATADGDADGQTDVWLLDEDGTLEVLSFTEENVFLTRDAGILESSGAFGVVDLDEDRVPDMAMGTADGWRVYQGQLLDGDGVNWRPRRPTVQRRAYGLVGSLVPFDVDPLLDELVAVAHLEDRTVVRRFSLGDAGPSQDDDIVLANTVVDVVDLAACGSEAWVLLPDEVVAVDLAAGRVAGRRAVEGTAVACGAGPDRVEAVVATAAGVQQLGPGASDEGVVEGAAVDAALVEGQVVACAAPCASWPLPSGVEVLVESVSDGIEIEGEAYPGGPFLAVQDTDDDGALELWARSEDGSVAVLREGPEGPVVERVVWTSSRYAGAAWVADAPGVGDAVWFADGGDLCQME